MDNQNNNPSQTNPPSDPLSPPIPTPDLTASQPIPDNPAPKPTVTLNQPANMSTDLGASNLNIPPENSVSSYDPNYSTTLQPSADRPAPPAPDVASTQTEPVPTFTPPPPPPGMETSAPVEPPQNQPPVTETSEAPTDLSHLTESPAAEQASTSDIYNPSVSAPETLVVPTDSSAPVATSVTTAPSRKFPIIALIGGVLVLLAVSGASAYFILGIGKPAATPIPTSAPINQTPLTNPPTPIPTPAASVPPESNASSFGALNGGAESTPSATPKSAADLLKSRNSSPSASPR